MFRGNGGCGRRGAQKTGKADGIFFGFFLAVEMWCWPSKCFSLFFFILSRLTNSESAVSSSRPRPPAPSSCSEEMKLPCGRARKHVVVGGWEENLQASFGDGVLFDQVFFVLFRPLLEAPLPLTEPMSPLTNLKFKSPATDLRLLRLAQ